MSWAAGAAHLERALACQLEHLPVQQEEPGQPEPCDQLQLVVEPLTSQPLVTVRLRVPVDEGAVADLAQLDVGRIDAVREVGVAVAELLRQVELAAVGDLTRPLRCCARQPLQRFRGRDQDALVVAAPFALAPVQRRALLDRDKRILQSRATRAVRMHIAGRDGGHTKRLGELAQHGVAPRVTTLVRTLQLDVERAGKRACELGRRVRVDDAEPMARAARERDKPFGVLRDYLHARLGRQQIALAPGYARARVRVGEDATEVRVAALRLTEQRHVRARRPASPRRR